MSQKYEQKLLMFGLSCSLCLVLLFSQTLNASQMAQFTVEGVLEEDESSQWFPNFDGINFSGASLSGVINVTLDDYSNPSGYSTLYGLDDWSIQLTASTGESIYFNPTGDVRESNNVFRLNSLTNVMSFNVKEYGYIDIVGADGLLLGAPSLSLNIQLPSNIPMGSTLDYVLESESSLVFSDLSYGYIEFGVNNSAYFESAMVSISDSVSPIPEPSSIVLFGLGGLMVFGIARRKQNKQVKKS